MLPVLQIGPLALQTPGLALILGLWIGLSLSERLAARFKADASKLYNLIFTALAAGVIGARLSFVAQSTQAFIASPLNIFSLNPGLLDPVGGLAIGIMAAAIYGNRAGLPLWPTLDALSPLLAVFTIALGVSHLASGKAFGMPTSLPWGIDLWGAKRHPTQIYEIVAGLLTLGLIWPRSTERTQSRPRVAGSTFGIFLALSAGMFLIIAGLRGDSHVLANGIRTSQLAAWAILAFSLWLLGKLQKSNTPQD
jgi:prolipoprotein diacylglyceryltransferase